MRGFSTLGSANGICGDSTVAAITAFQAGFLRKPDGVVDPGGTSWQHLAASFSGTTTAGRSVLASDSVDRFGALAPR